ncbi:MAG TPA: amino acid transport protein [Verrucomicrobiae bacterium]|jgi:hypothetical protein|nr:amino acid transport protein [Verrucomicrobiae bacterium]
MPFNLDSGTIFASILWGGIGSGYFIYGWKQRRTPAIYGGLALMAVSYLIASPLWMSVSSIALMVGIYYWSKNSD